MLSAEKRRKAEDRIEKRNHRNSANAIDEHANVDI